MVYFQIYNEQICISAIFYSFSAITFSISGMRKGEREGGETSGKHMFSSSRVLVDKMRNELVKNIVTFLDKGGGRVHSTFGCGKRNPGSKLACDACDLGDIVHHIPKIVYIYKIKISITTLIQDYGL